MKPELAQWVNQPGALTGQRNALAAQVERGNYTFDEAKREAGLERSKLIESVRDGDMEIPEAEQEAALLGCGPLAPLPEPTHFDPMEEPHWSLYMALAWIMWQTPDDVRRHWDKWRAAARVWQPNGKGHSLLELKPTTTFFELRDDAMIQESRGNAPRVSAEDARSRLWRALQSCEVKAFGVNAAGNRVPIEPHEFVDLQLGEYALKGGHHRDIMLGREDVLGQFEAAGTPKAKSGAKPQFQYGPLRDELVRLMIFHGEFSTDDPEWNGQEKLIEALQRFHADKYQREPGRSTLQPHVDKWLTEWRRTANAEN